MTFSMETNGKESRDGYFTEAQKEIMCRAIDRYGVEHQIGKAIEELAELACELAKFLNGRDDDRQIAACREELADVQNVCFELEDILGDVSSWRDAKLERLERRMEAGL